MEGLVQYDKLSLEAKENALKSCLHMEKEAIQKLMAFRKEQGLHHKVNDKFSLKRVIRQIELYKKWSDNLKEFERVVVGNLCMFTKEGFYYSYVQKRVVCDF
jgi:hypothetical protein